MHSPAALTQLMRDALSGEVADGLDVVAGSGMNVTVNAGTALVGRDPSYSINIIGTETVNVGAASPSNPINAVIVAYVDRNVAGDRSVTDNTNDVFKLTLELQHQIQLIQQILRFRRRLVRQIHLLY